jgi:hypothetical protein
MKKLSQSGVVITDQDALTMYDLAMKAVSAHNDSEGAEILGTIQYNAVKAKPKDEKLAVECYKACMAWKNYDFAQQIANSLERYFPENRKYAFWSLTTMALFVNSKKGEKTKLDMVRKITQAKIKKLADATSAGKDQTALPPRSIQTPQELAFLYRITKMWGSLRDINALLHDPALGPDSKAAKGEWWVIRTKVETLEELEEWEELFEYCLALLKKARVNVNGGSIVDARGGDWVVWQNLMAATLNLGDES